MQDLMFMVEQQAKLGAMSEAERAELQEGTIGVAAGSGSGNTTGRGGKRRSTGGKK